MSEPEGAREASPPERSVLSASIYRGISQTCAGLLYLGSNALVARTLGPKGNGTYNLLTFLSAIAVQLTSLGVPAANTYFVANGKFSRRALVSNSFCLLI